MSSDEPRQSEFLADFFTQRIRLAWSQNQLHVAEFLYQNLSEINLQPRQSQKLTLQIAETFQDIGTDLLQKKSLDGAIKYLRWSWDYLLQVLRVGNLTVDASELSINVRHNLTKALIRRNANSELDLERATEFLDGLSLVCFPSLVR